MEVQVVPLSLGWGRAPNGHFVIAVSLGGVVAHAFILDAAEEAALRAALAGVLVATATPQPQPQPSALQLTR